jgi:hypothetical protein
MVMISTTAMGVMWEETGLDRSLIMTIKAWPTSPLTGSKSITISGRVLSGYAQAPESWWATVTWLRGTGRQMRSFHWSTCLVPGLPLPPFPVPNRGSSLKDTAVPPQPPPPSPACPTTTGGLLVPPVARQGTQWPMIVANKLIITV